MAGEDGTLLQETASVYARAARLLDPVRLQVWEAMGISFPQLRILFRVRNQAGIDVRSLAAAMGISPSAASQQVDRLVERGFLDRSDDPEDRRRVRLELTDLGRQASGEISRAARGHVASVLATLSDDELRQLKSLLERVLSRAAGETAAAG